MDGMGIFGSKPSLIKKGTTVHPRLAGSRMEPEEGFFQGGLVIMKLLNSLQGTVRPYGCFQKEEENPQNGW